MTIHRSPLVLSTALILLLASCGQDPSFNNREDSVGKNSGDSTNGNPGGTDDTGMNGPDGEGEPGSGAGEVALPAGGGNEWSPDWAGGAPAVDADGDGIPDDATAGGDGSGSGNNGNNTGGGGEPLPDIPGASDGDLPALHKCLSQWRNHPFRGTVYNYDRIHASVSVGGFGNVINDNESTEEPYLILVDAGVNVGGAPTYNLLNKNGYYCLKVNVNVLTNLNVNLHCNARLADQRVNVNVGSTQNDTTSAVGVHVLSNVQVNTVRPEGDSCIR
jgi:hypothetical protein